MGVYSDGSYNVPSGLIYSFPVTCKNGEWCIVQGENLIDNIISVLLNLLENFTDSNEFDHCIDENRI